MNFKIRVPLLYRKILFPFLLLSILLDVNFYKSVVHANLDIKPANENDLALYEGMGVSYLCIASRKEIKLDFQKSLGVAASTFVAVIQSKHGSKLIEKDKEITVTNKVLFENAAFRILGRAIQTCPDNVPKKSKQEFDNAIKQLQNSKNN
tara:strand:- start:880 stop:1329 length:450 start_codon:yes stop_codon:yes gene_type:complete